MILGKLMTSLLFLAVSLLHPVEHPTTDPLGQAATQSVNPLGDNLTIEDAVTLFEKKFNKKAMLPQKLPFRPSDTGGSFTESIKHLTVSYFDKQTKQYVRIEQFLAQSPVTFAKTSNEKEVTLADGTRGVYIQKNQIDPIDKVRFIKEDMVFIVSMFKQDGKITLDELLTVVNSMV